VSAGTTRVFYAQYTRVDISRLDARFADPHERRQFVIEHFTITSDQRTERRIAQRWCRWIAGPDMRDRAIVLGFWGSHRTDNGQLVHHHRGLRPKVGKLHTRDISRDRSRRPLIGRTDLWIERIELTGPAIHPQQDDRLALLLQLGSTSHQHVAPAQCQNSSRSDTQASHKLTPACQASAIDSDIK
jgi:hypothetical protein